MKITIEIDTNRLEMPDSEIGGVVAFLLCRYAAQQIMSFNYAMKGTRVVPVEEPTDGRLIGWISLTDDYYDGGVTTGS